MMTGRRVLSVVKKKDVSSQMAEVISTCFSSQLPTWTFRDHWPTGIQAPVGNQGSPPEKYDLNMLDLNHYRYKHIFEYTNLTIYMTIYLYIYK